MMGAIIRLNGVELQDSLVVVDTLNRKISVETMESGEIGFWSDEVFVEVNIYGNLPL